MKEQSRAIVDKKKLDQQLKREREAANKKRKEENAKKSEIVQVVSEIKLVSPNYGPLCSLSCVVPSMIHKHNTSAYYAFMMQLLFLYLCLDSQYIEAEKDEEKAAAAS